VRHFQVDIDTLTHSIWCINQTTTIGSPEMIQVLSTPNTWPRLFFHMRRQIF
jgi:hypothetical protein